MEAHTCLHPRQLSIEKLRQIQQELNELAKLFAQLKCDILGVSLPVIHRYHDGRFETIYAAEVLDALNRVHKEWITARDHYLACNHIDLTGLRWDEDYEPTTGTFYGIARKFND
jgi:hypothetical protein